ncbi:MAG: CU044_5270 family protein, partial [Thermoleophilaceae bacterium]|nr:CU044_5270 family protein [Thermoleophilaceae bacterium]
IVVRPVEAHHQGHRLAGAFAIGGHDVATAPATAAEALAQAARAAELHPLPFPKPTQYVHSRLRTRNLMGVEFRAGKHGSFQAVRSGMNEHWISARGGGYATNTEQHTTFVTARDRRLWQQSKQVVGEDPIREFPTGIYFEPRPKYILGTHELTRREVLNYPTNPAAIFRRLQRETKDFGSDSDREVFVLLNDALRGQILPAKLRAGLLNTLALVPGVKYEGETKDLAGRPGLAVSRKSTYGTSQLVIFDPKTSLVLGEREILIKKSREFRGWPVGTVIGESTTLLTEVVDQLPLAKRKKLLQAKRQRMQELRSQSQAGQG